MYFSCLHTITKALSIATAKKRKEKKKGRQKKRDIISVVVSALPICCRCALQYALKLAP